MSKKQQVLSAISSAVYGEEVRGAIHDGIEECYDNVENKIVSSNTAPTSPNTQIWIDTSQQTTDSMPQIDDTNVSSGDTWSSQKITDEIGQLSEEIDYCSAGKRLFEQADMERGSYNASGGTTSVTNRVRVKGFIRVTAGDSIQFEPGDTIDQFLIGYFSTAKVFIKDSSWFTGNQPVNFADDGYIVIVFRNSENPNINVSDYDATTYQISYTRNNYVYLNDAINDVIDATGRIFNISPVKGYAISANVGGNISFVENEDRMYYKFTSSKDFTISNTGYDYALIVGDSDNKCVSNTGWTKGPVTGTGNGAYTFYLLCKFVDESYAPTISVESGWIKDAFEAVDNELLSLQVNDIAQQNGFTKAIELEWESGSINSTTGADVNPDVNVIRTPLPRIQLDGDINIILVNDQYRIKIYEFTGTTGDVSSASSWYNTPGTYNYTISASKYYRIQIATNSASAMNVSEALKSVVLVYTADAVQYPVDAYQFADYWKSYIADRVNLINSYLTDGNDKSVFLFLTDTHWNDNKKNYLNAYGINTELMRYVNNLCNIGTCIHGGDLNSEYRSNKNTARLYMTKPVSMMRSAFDNVLLTRGNHDDNIEGSNNVWSYVITQSDSYSYMFRNTHNVVFGESGTYFYQDNPHEKLRIISIDCVDFPYDNSEDTTKSDLKVLAYGYTQLKWLCDVLKETPDGYHIVIYTHAMLAPSAVTIDYPSTSPQTRALDYLIVCEMLKAYKNRQNFTYTMDGSFVSVHKDYYTGNLAGNFTSCGATIVGVFSGHEHIDCIEEIRDGNGVGIGIYNTCTQNSSNMFGSSVISSTYQHPMEMGTTTELVWDVVVIDRNTKHVDMIRIGANGANTDVEAADVRSFDY